MTASRKWAFDAPREAEAGRVRRTRDAMSCGSTAVARSFAIGIDVEMSAPFSNHARTCDRCGADERRARLVATGLARMAGVVGAAVSEIGHHCDGPCRRRRSIGELRRAGARQRRMDQSGRHGRGGCHGRGRSGGSRSQRLGAIPRHSRIQSRVFGFTLGRTGSYTSPSASLFDRWKRGGV